MDNIIFHLQEVQLFETESVYLLISPFKCQTEDNKRMCENQNCSIVLKERLKAT